MSLLAELKKNVKSKGRAQSNCETKQMFFIVN